MIINAHCHYLPGDSTFVNYLTRSGQIPIKRNLIWPGLCDNYEKANLGLFNFTRKYSGVFTGIAFVHSRRDRGKIYRMVKMAIEDYGFAGIKVHRRDYPISTEICDTAEAFGVPVIYDIMGVYQEVDMLANRYPNVTFIIPHLGSFQEESKAMVWVSDQLVHYANIYTDTSGVRWFDLLQKTIDTAGAHKILFGTDGPWLHPGIELQKISLLRLTAQQREMILYRNVMRLFSLEENTIHLSTQKFQPELNPAY